MRSHTQRFPSKNRRNRRMLFESLELREVLTAGMLDTTFGEGGKVLTDFGFKNDRATAVAIADDGKIVVAGCSSLNVAPFSANFVVARYNSDGTLDESFGDNGAKQIGPASSYCGISKVAIQPDGEIYLVGYSAQIDEDFVIIRLLNNGQTDPSFGYGTLGSGISIIDFWPEKQFVRFSWPLSSYDRATDLSVEPDGSLILYGMTGVFGGRIDDVMRMSAWAALDSNGRPTLKFFPNEDLFLNGTPVIDPLIIEAPPPQQIDGKNVLPRIWHNNPVNGVTEPTDGVTPANFSDFTTHSIDGSDFSLRRGNDPLFGDGGLVSVDFGSSFASANAVAIQPDGQIVVVGYADQNSADGENFAIARISAFEHSIIGTDGDDEILVEPGTLSGTFKTTVNGLVADNLVVDGELFVTGRGGNDTMVIVASPPAKTILSGNDGSDHYEITFGALEGEISVVDTGDSGIDSLTVNGTPSDDVIFKNSVYITLGEPVQESISYVGIETKSVHGQGGNDIITDPGSDTYLFGDSGDDTIVINSTSGSGLVADGGPGSDNYVIVAGGITGPISIEDSGVTGQDNVTITGSTIDSLEKTETGFTLNGVAINLAAQVETVVLDGFNTAPIISIAAVQQCGETDLTIQLDAVDPDDGDTITYAVTFVSKSGAGAINPPSDFYVDSTGLFHWTPRGGQLGLYTFNVTVTDNHGLSADQTIAVSTLGVIDGVLTIIGSAGDDKIDVKTTDGNPGELTVKINERDYHYQLKPKNNPENPYTGVTLIHTCGLQGDDQINIHPNVATNAWLEGGAGNDQLRGSEVDDVIFGGSGDDKLFGDEGNDVLIGGYGADKLAGEKGHDVLVSNECDGGLSFAAMWSIGQAWANSRNVTSEPLEEVLDELVGDNNTDTLTGGEGADLFVITGTDKVTDFIRGKRRTNKDGDMLIKDGLIID